MAVKWAVANGNWSAGGTWNDGVVPASGDIVYCNGHEITLNVDILSQVYVKNTTNPNTNISGGGFICTNGRTYNIDIEVGAAMFLHRSGVNSFTINGNITADNTTNGVFYKSSPYTGQFNVTINGNITLNNATLIETYGNTSTTGYIINGNIYSNVALIKCSQGGNAITNFIFSVNGICEWTACPIGTFSNTNDQHFTFNGVWRIKKSLSIPNILYWVTINGTIEYEFNAITLFPFTLNLFEIENPDTFLMKDISEQRTEYVWGEKVGTYTPDYPPESVVLKDYEYGDSDDRKTGTMVQEVNVEVGCVTKEDVREGVPLIGMSEVGTLVVPSVDDVREGVVFDNGSVGTLIVQGGGDRLRIADFSYYTNAQSDTYIVDLTEQDKPKFAVAEERVLIEMFPDLDLDNIPDKYFDDLFVKYLKYRLIVEYYRTAGINSTFTPSEPTTEIVNYQNVRNEVWLNSANIYLKAWAKKYPESIVKPQRILL